MIFVQNIIPTIRPCRNGRGELFSVAASTIDIERLLMLRPQQGADDFQEGKAAAEVFELALHRFGGEAVSPDAGRILFGEHRRFRF